MIIGSSSDLNLKNKLTENIHVPSLTLSQLIYCNTVCQRGNLGTSCNTSAQEMPLNLCVSFSLHSQTRRPMLIGRFYDLGLVYFHLGRLILSKQLGNNLRTQFGSEGVIFPAKIRSYLLTKFNADNIDHNPNSGFKKDSWQGTTTSKINLKSNPQF